MVKAGQISCCYGPKKLGRHVAAMCNRTCFFLDFHSKNGSLFWNEIRLCQKNINILLLFSQPPLREAGSTDILNKLEITDRCPAGDAGRAGYFPTVSRTWTRTTLQRLYFHAWRKKFVLSD